MGSSPCNSWSIEKERKKDNDYDYDNEYWIESACQSLHDVDLVPGYRPLDDAAVGSPLVDGNDDEILVEQIDVASPRLDARVTALLHTANSKKQNKNQSLLKQSSASPLRKLHSCANYVAFVLFVIKKGKQLWFIILCISVATGFLPCDVSPAFFRVHVPRALQ